MYDIIGDLHGHADALESLLEKLGYDKERGYYQHANRKVIFVGDYIDRGPKIRQTLEIVKAMVDKGHAIALMGNHEFNAILYNTKDGECKLFREHSDKHKAQHIHTLEQFKGKDEEYTNYINWFKTLPLYYEDENLRVVHACWDENIIQYLKEILKEGKISNELLLDKYYKGSKLYEAIEVTLKGKELLMPEGLTFKDKYGHERSHLRIKWWINPRSVTYKQYSVENFLLTEKVKLLSCW